jgi:hypothetical protein
VNAVRAGLAAALVFFAGCAFIPRDNPRLDEANEDYALAQRDPALAALAPIEMRRAADAIDKAVRARASLDDPATIDHLAYLARQQIAIAREAARMRGYDWDPALVSH